MERKRKRIDLVGERYGSLIVISESEMKGQQRVFLCKCDCENVVPVRMANLRNGHTKSCGCLQRKQSSNTNTKNLLDKTFGQLKVMEKSTLKSNNPKDRKVRWKCLCECGEPCIVSSQNLLSGATISCGCKMKKTIYQAKSILHDEYSVDGIIIPNLTRKRRSDNKTGHKGVTVSYNKNGVASYKAMLGFKGTNHYLGRHGTLEDAVRARQKAEEQYFKPFIEKFNDTTRNRVNLMKCICLELPDTTY
ncbi:hypothetical protein M5X06_22215 [Paenibacillus alvei]|uniref:AP2 domain-containing protein n=1 Tax=Paenibacillus alvei TaxID=44250 RepID=A0ABT4H3H7_PAEAL|nr:hypothetical protein [Paenibacillus alvei]MCY9763206.1 hypothetical protein [Paenibacillus alvei]MCY9769505.1 hypothetical protein [Paenibacillus alvei]